MAVFAGEPVNQPLRPDVRHAGIHQQQRHGVIQLWWLYTHRDNSQSWRSDDSSERKDDQTKDERKIGHTGALQGTKIRASPWLKRWSCWWCWALSPWPPAWGFPASCRLPYADETRLATSNYLVDKIEQLKGTAFASMAGGSDTVTINERPRLHSNLDRRQRQSRWHG